MLSLQCTESLSHSHVFFTYWFPPLQTSSSAHLSSFSFRHLPQKTRAPTPICILPTSISSKNTNTNTHSLPHSLVHMDSQNLKQRRVADEPDPDTNTSTTTMNKNNYRSKSDMAKRGLRSLAVAVSLPVALHLLTLYLGSTDGYRTSSKPFWFPPLWGLRLTCLASSFLMGLSAWLVWAEGGFHKNPVALPVYLAQLVLGLLWDPIVFGAGAPWVGMVVCVGMFAALVGCSKVFQDVNQTAGDLMKPCLAWVAFLAVVNLKLVYL